MRAAIIGAGPRGLWAAEALLGASASPRLSVDVWDDRAPGIGSAYAADQPDAWRLNVRSSIVHTGIGSLDAWRRDHGEEDPLDPFPSRSLVGRYLADAWAALGADARLRHVDRRVTQLDPVEGGWLVDGERYDEVLLVTGHAERPEPDLGAVSPGSAVAVKGAALTFLDIALALTQGRGGQWEPGDGPPTYQPAGREPRVIWPTSRSGRFMEVKPEPGGELDRRPEPDAWAAARDAITASPDLDALVEALADAACAALGGDERGEIYAVLTGLDFSGDPVGDLRQSWEVATGRREPGARWAVGAAWRGLYPAIVERVGFGGVESLSGFWALARRLERVAFGPPPVNGGKLLGLLEAGLVDVTHLADLAAAAGDADVVLDAVIASPGVHPRTLAGDLVARDLASLGPFGSLLVDPDASVVGAPHLAAAGRLTEGTTLGNDTLSRSLHPQIDRWAARVAARTDQEDR